MIAKKNYVNPAVFPQNLTYKSLEFFILLYL